MESKIAAQVDQLTLEVAALRGRVARLEGRTTIEPALEAAAAPVGEPALPSLGASGHLGFAGRTLIVLGGAFLLRALTDGGLLSPLLGASSGLIYALAMLVLADRSAPRDRVSAGHHGFAAAVIAYPLLWETTTRLAVFDAATAATTATLFLALGLLVARHRALPFVAWSSLAFALATMLPLLVATGRILPFVVALFVAAAICEALAFDARWRRLRWPPALALDVVLLQLGLMLVRSDGLPEGYAPISIAAAVTVELALPVLYLSSIAARTLVKGREITNFGIFQCTVALLIGLGGAARLLVFHGASLRWVGVVAVALGAASYAVAYVASHARRARNFHFYVTLGGVVTLVGIALLLDGTPRVAAWSAVAIAAHWMGHRHRRGTLRFHASAYLLAAAAGSGLFAIGWRGSSLGPMIAAAAALACWLIGTRARDRDEWTDRVPDLVAATILLCVALGLAARALSLAIHDAAFVASARSGVIAATAIGLAWLASRRKLRELAWLVYPLLIAGGLELLLVDFRVGRPASLVLSFAFYGAALILAPRLARS